MLFFYHFTVLTFFYRYMFQQLWFYWLKDGIPSSSGVADTYKTTSLFIFVSSHALLYQRNPRLPYTCSCSPSLPCSVVPHFRPVPFRILDLSSVPFRSVPFRSVPFREIATTLCNLTDPEGLISAVVRRELAAHQRTTDTSPTDGGESIVVAVGRSAIPSHGGIDGEDRC